MLTALLVPISNVLGQKSKLKTYGYFGMEVEVSNKDATGKIWTFDQHHFNIIAVYQIDQYFRVFSEIDWEHGASHKPGEITGKIYLSNAFLDYKLTDAFRVRIGKFVSPFGIYNERHDATPTFISTKLPHSVYGDHELSTGIKERLFAETSTGIQVLGNLFASGWEVKYQWYLSNGRGTKPSEQDDNPNKGIGARFVVSPPIEDLRLGASYYSDRNGKDGNTRQSALGFDAELDNSNLHLESEVIIHRIEKVDGTGISNGTFRKGFGYYVLVACTFFDKLTPFTRYEFHDHDIDEPGVNENLGMIGINYSITPKVYLKNEVHFHNFHGTAADSYEMFIASIAVAF